MTNAAASSYIDAITRSGKPLFKSDQKALEAIKEQVFKNRDLTGAQAEILNDLYKNAREK